MPYSLTPIKTKTGKVRCYEVKNTISGKIHSRCTSKKKAEAQLRLLRSLESQEGAGWFGDLIRRITPEKRKEGVLPPQSRELLSKIGNEPITSLVVVRTPLDSFVKSLLNVVSLGTYSSAVKKSSYDEMFHLTLQINGKYTWEKLEVVRLQQKNPFKAKSESFQIPAPSGITIQQMVDKTREAMGDQKFSDYDPFNNNCQDFLLATLKAINALTPQAEQFIKQDAQKVLQKLPPWTSKISKFITDIGAVASKVIEGEGKKQKGGKSRFVDKQIRQMEEMENEEQKEVPVEIPLSDEALNTIEDLEQSVRAIVGEIESGLLNSLSTQQQNQIRNQITNFWETLGSAIRTRNENQIFNLEDEWITFLSDLPVSPSFLNLGQGMKGKIISDKIKMKGKGQKISRISPLKQEKIRLVKFIEDKISELDDIHFPIVPPLLRKARLPLSRMVIGLKSQIENASSLEELMEIEKKYITKFVRMVDKAKTKFIGEMNEDSKHEDEKEIPPEMGESGEGMQSGGFLPFLLGALAPSLLSGLFGKGIQGGTLQQQQERRRLETEITRFLNRFLEEYYQFVRNLEDKVVSVNPVRGKRVSLGSTPEDIRAQHREWTSIARNFISQNPIATTLDGRQIFMKDLVGVDNVVKKLENLTWLNSYDSAVDDFSESLANKVLYLQSGSGQFFSRQQQQQQPQPRLPRRRSLMGQLQEIGLPQDITQMIQEYALPTGTELQSELNVNPVLRRQRRERVRQRLFPDAPAGTGMQSGGFLPLLLGALAPSLLSGLFGGGMYGGMMPFEPRTDQEIVRRLRMKKILMKILPEDIVNQILSFMQSFTSEEEIRSILTQVLGAQNVAAIIEEMRRPMTQEQRREQRRQSLIPAQPRRTRPPSSAEQSEEEKDYAPPSLSPPSTPPPKKSKGGAIKSVRKPNSWTSALKEWNAKKGGKYCIPKKGSKEYEAVRKLMK